MFDLDNIVNIKRISKSLLSKPDTQLLVMKEFFTWQLIEDDFSNDQVKTSA